MDFFRSLSLSPPPPLLTQPPPAAFTKRQRFYRNSYLVPSLEGHKEDASRRNRAPVALVNSRLNLACVSPPPTTPKPYYAEILVLPWRPHCTVSGSAKSFAKAGRKLWGHYCRSRIDKAPPTLLTPCLTKYTPEARWTVVHTASTRVASVHVDSVNSPWSLAALHSASSDFSEGLSPLTLASLRLPELPLLSQEPDTGLPPPGMPLSPFRASLLGGSEASVISQLLENIY